jgi:hypothetical protein
MEIIPIHRNVFAAAIVSPVPADAVGAVMPTASLIATMRPCRRATLPKAALVRGIPFQTRTAGAKPLAGQE